MSAITLPDGTQIITTTTTNGQTVQVIPGLGTPGANRDTLVQRANTALANNSTFLAIGAPTQAQAVAQVQALTRQVNALIRFTLGQFDTITDS